MTSGMLWFDNSNRTLAQKIQIAVDYYEKKYGRKPDLCLVHPSFVAGQDLQSVKGVTVRAFRPVLPGHIWIGIADVQHDSNPA